MTEGLLDTSVLVGLLRRQTPAFEWLRQMPASWEGGVGVQIAAAAVASSDALLVTRNGAELLEDRGRCAQERAGTRAPPPGAWARAT